MSERSQQLVERFQRVNDEVHAVAERCSPEEWLATCPAEGWTVAAVVYHIAGSYPFQLELIRRFARGETIPATHAGWSTIDKSNARAAEQFASVDQARTLALLKRNVAEVREFLAGLSDAQLDYTAYFPLMNETRTTQRMIERILLAHPEEHLESIRARVSQDS
jgi:uncharacterized damage-inducible protein DinB